MVIGLVVVLVFILLIGLFHADEKGFNSPKWMTITAIAIAFIAVVIAVLYFTGAWDAIAELWRDENSSAIGNVVTIVVILVILAFIFFGAESKDHK